MTGWEKDARSHFSHLAPVRGEPPTPENGGVERWTETVPSLSPGHHRPAQRLNSLLRGVKVSLCEPLSAGSPVICSLKPSTWHTRPPVEFPYSFTFFLIKKKLCIYLWLRWVFVAACGLSLVAASSSHSLVVLCRLFFFKKIFIWLLRVLAVACYI